MATKIFQSGLIGILGFILPLSVTAANLDITFSGAVYEYTDENFDLFSFDNGDFSYGDILVSGHFTVNTSQPESAAFPNNWFDTNSGLFIEVEDFSTPFGLYDSLSLDGLVDDGGLGLQANNTFVGNIALGSNRVETYLQDFFIGNMDLRFESSGPDFNDDISVLDFAAAGTPSNFFVLDGFIGDGSTGNFQTGSGEYYFDISDITITPSPVPLPAAAWLFGSALLWLGIIKRRRC